VNKALLDTDIFSEIQKGSNQNVISRASAYHAAFGYYTTSTITVMEIVKGFHKVQREDRIQDFLSALPLNRAFDSGPRRRRTCRSNLCGLGKDGTTDWPCRPNDRRHYAPEWFDSGDWQFSTLPAHIKPRVRFDAGKLASIDAI